MNSKHHQLVVITALVATAALSFAEGTYASEWEPLNQILESAISEDVWPGCAAAVFIKDKVLYKSVRGRYTYGIPPPENPGENPLIVTNVYAQHHTHTFLSLSFFLSFPKLPSFFAQTLFDMASCTKVIGPTSSLALLYQRGDVGLDDPVHKYLPGFEANGKESVTVRHLLLHNSGLPEGPSVSYCSKKFDCPETRKPQPQLSFDCRARCYRALLGDPLVRSPGAEYEYSDAGFMAVMYVVGRVAREKGYVQESDLRSDCPPDTDGWEQCFYEAFVRKYVFRATGMQNAAYLPGRELWKRCAPTANETAIYRHRQIQGEVHDENAFAMGGISGHAGVFADVDDVVAFTRRWLFAGAQADGFLNETTVKTFVTQYNHSQSSRALGWNTNADDAPDKGWNHLCGTLSETTFTHVGFTGTMICADPERKMGLALLTNRVYPDSSTGSQTSAYRRKFSQKAQEIFDSIYGHF